VEFSAMISGISGRFFTPYTYIDEKDILIHVFYHYLPPPPKPYKL